MKKKIKLDRVETFLGRNLACDFVVVGIDVSLYSTGIALIRTTDSYLIIEKLDTIKVPKNPKHFLKTTDSFLEQLDQIKRDIISKFTINEVIIEDCFLKKNVTTLKALARFGILAYERFRGCANKCHFKLPTSARRIINFKKLNKKAKGLKLKKELIEYISATLDIGFEIEDHDQVDALVLALAGLVIE